MKTLIVNDLPQNDELDSKAMAAITGGDGVVDDRLMAYITYVNLYTHGMTDSDYKY